MDKAKADAELTRLDRLERGHAQAQTLLRHSLRTNHAAIDTLTQEITDLGHAISARRDTRGDAFTMTVGGVAFTDRTEAGQALQTWLSGVLNRPGPSPLTLPLAATLGGHSFAATIWRAPSYQLALPGVPRAAMSGKGSDLAEAKPSSLPIRLENQLTRLDRILEEAGAALDTAREEISRATAQLAAPFAYAADLDTAREKVAALNQELARLAAPAEQPDPHRAPPAQAPVAAPSLSGASHPRPPGQSHPAAVARAVLTPPRSAQALTRASPSDTGPPEHSEPAPLRRPDHTAPDLTTRRTR
jgi:hypothetical protein